ncbi:TIGR02300 family protein [Sphingomonas quercus]|uniref:TIGR02300 family protein n=1 Tax=Sphingomonas quercus TaxID=2842451 RepID=A0ABS6BKY6_9SPHN|nr:TIGR02300 family protein [Sphingomonas quercus]MBU3078968.1 TIGR02300 family protein [Sphingomonas quercus]
MVKPEWGAKRSCPKCGTRFYDLGKEDPVTCIACGTQWEPEPVLKSKQPLPFDAPKKESEKDEDSDLNEDLSIDEDEEISPDDETDLGGDDDLGVATDDGDDEH